MDIIVKSFYRPYYLERCLKSIFLNVSGNYKVTVLDDGTPEEYLSIIRARFPQIQIVKSEEYSQKVESIKHHLSGAKTYVNRSVPVQMWRESIDSASDYFLLLEEDAWVISSVSVDAMKDLMQRQDILILKLGWNGNDSLGEVKELPLFENVMEFVPSMPIKNLFIMRHYFNNTFRIRSVLQKLNLVGIRNILPYYELYTVSSAVYKKDYWQYVWKGARSKIDESAQLYRALKWYKEMQSGRYAKTIEEYIHTSFITASYNRFKLVDFDMIRLNFILNEAWLNGELNAFQNFPKDFNLENLKDIVNRKNDPDCTTSSWVLWINLFKNLHRQVGSKID